MQFTVAWSGSWSGTVDVILSWNPLFTFLEDDFISPPLLHLLSWFFLHQDDYSDFTLEKYQHLVLCKDHFTFLSRMSHQFGRCGSAKFVTKSNTHIILYFSFNNLLLYNPENYNIDYHIAPSAVFIFLEGRCITEGIDWDYLMPKQGLKLNIRFPTIEHGYYKIIKAHSYIPEAQELI
jgi:hypothetical protein